MTHNGSEYCFDQCHLDVARHSTDDFNLFHDRRRWQLIRYNPYGGPIALGFQLEALVDDCIEQARRSQGQDDRAPDWSNYEVHFAEALRPGERFRVQVRPTRYRDGAALTRVLVRKGDGAPLLLATREDATRQHFTSGLGQDVIDRAMGAPDRAFLPGSGVFIKRKYLNTSNGKNFLLGALVESSDYFDELAEQVQFPRLFIASYLSCALLERGQAEGYDFRGDPQVYVTHRISVDCRVQRALRSNDRLDLLIAPPTPVAAGKGLTDTQVAQLSYRCLAYAVGRGVVLEAELTTAALHALIGR